jgi:redox-sensitive bicupin YhaK (pirin superfamily)
MISVRRAGDRFRAEHDGITTWHSFSAGPHYDPANVAFGSIVACDEHLLAPGAGFPRHTHARVELVSWVLDGALRHTDGAGRDVIVRPGEVHHQIAGRGIEHVERNASDTVPLRFVQLWLLADHDDPMYELTATPVRLGNGTFSAVRSATVSAPRVHVFATARCTVAGHELRTGDTLRATDETLPIAADGDVLVVELDRN